jgi:hypothetical protein
MRQEHDVWLLLEIEDRSSKLCENAQTKNRAEMKSRRRTRQVGKMIEQQNQAGC